MNHRKLKLKNRLPVIIQMKKKKTKNHFKKKKKKMKIIMKLIKMKQKRVMMTLSNMLLPHTVKFLNMSILFS